jgi:hypothetical protein
MPADQSAILPTGKSDSAGNGSPVKNIFGDVQNLLGFLLAGSGAILSFLGLRSTEVTTVLRNNAIQASLLALIFLLGILAAVLTMVIGDTSARLVSWEAAGSLVLALLGAGALVIHLIPVSSAPGMRSLVLGYALGLTGVICLVASTVTRDRFIGMTGLSLALLGVVILAFYIILIHLGKKVDQGLMVTSLILGGISLLLGLILLVPPRVSRKLKTARAQRVEGNAEESGARNAEAAGITEESAARAEARAAVSEERMARSRAREAAGYWDRRQAKKDIAVAQDKAGAAREKAARAQGKIADARLKMIRAQEKSRRSYKWYGWQPVPRVPLTSLLIIASVMLIAIGTYGGMRLESKSQLSFSSQVGATFSADGPTTTASIKIAATKLSQKEWIFVYVYAVPTGTKLTSMCRKYVVPAILKNEKLKGQEDKTALARSYLEHCSTDPCYYLAPGNREGWPSACDVLLSGTIDPDAAGDVDETLSVPFKTSSYEDVDVRPEVCQFNPAASCEGAETGQNSRLDWVISPPEDTAAS